MHIWFLETHPNHIHIHLCHEIKSAWEFHHLVHQHAVLQCTLFGVSRRSLYSALLKQTTHFQYKRTEAKALVENDHLLLHGSVKSVWGNISGTVCPVPDALWVDIIMEHWNAFIITICFKAIIKTLNTCYRVLVGSSSTCSTKYCSAVLWNFGVLWHVLFKNHFYELFN